MLGPYTANKDGTIAYRGNNLFSPMPDISQDRSIEQVEGRVEQLKSDPMWGAISRINHRIAISANEYFDQLGALFTTLPLTTRMISSPGAVYGKEAINYTTDTCPITLKWFDLPREAFLSESSQIYLELALMQQGVNQVYSIYNSFRKERADPTHLSEFHHVEYEGKISQPGNERVALGLVGKIIGDCLDKNESDLAMFLSPAHLSELGTLSQDVQMIPRITYAQAQEVLLKETKNPKYQRFTMQDNFGSWEEVKLTEIFGGMVAIREFPLLEVPFYHACVDGKTPAVADNTDIIWPGYRETIGSGHRVRSQKELEEKARIFSLPRGDYQPYLNTRKFSDYQETSGFGLGWERLLHGLLEMPSITSVCHFPRVDRTLKP
jgi:aspartyl/asparaginyl-tRNA synthetase